MYHNFFIHITVDENFGCFHVLAIVNSATMDTGVHMSFKVIIFSQYMPSGGIAGSYASFWIFPGGSVVKNLSAMQEPQETWVRLLGQEDTLEEGMATHSSILVWRIPWTEEPGGL